MVWVKAYTGKNPRGPLMAEAQTKIKWNEESVIGGTFVQAVVVGLMSSETKQVQKLEHWEMRINANNYFKQNKNQRVRLHTIE